MTSRRRLALLLPAVALAGATHAPVPVTVSDEGFAPATLEARRDEAVRLTVKTADREHCFSLDAFRVEKRILPGRAVAVRFTPDTVGRFPYTCCLHGGETGTLVVED